MARFAVVNGNTVINFIVADSKEIAEEATKLTCVECPPNSSIDFGAYYNTETGLLS
jgi:hypothetical protein